MNETTKKIQEHVEHIAEKDTTRRRSMFETSDQSRTEKQKTDSFMEEWNKRWGHHNTDFVNVVKYPKDYVQRLQLEIELWVQNFKEMIENAKDCFHEMEYAETIEEVDFSPDKKLQLQVIDSKIKEFTDNANSVLKTFEITKDLQQFNIEKIDNEAKVSEKLIMMQLK